MPASMSRAAAAEVAAVPVDRERVRARAAPAFTVEYSATGGHAGRTVRSDGFFTERLGHRPAAMSSPRE